MSALFPNVPMSIQGVPTVLRRAGALLDAQQTLASAKDDITNTQQSQRWGIFTMNGAVVLEADNIVSLEHNAEYRIADYAIEGGSFESYDKVATPFEIRLAASRGGTLSDRSQFQTAAQAALESLETYNVVTPERVYLNVNVTRIGTTRNASAGAGMITIELVLQEVRQAAQAAFSTTSTSDVAQPIATAPVTKTPPVTAAPGTTKRPAAVRKINQGSVQAKVRAVPSSAADKAFIADLYK